MIGRPDAQALMAGELGQWLAAQEGERQAVKAKARHIWQYGVAFAAGLVFLIVAVGGSIETALKVGFFVGLAGFGLSEWAKRPLLKRIKGGINAAIAKAIGMDYAVDCEPGSTFERAKQFDMVPGYDNSRFQDLWWGLVAGQPFTMHEARLTEVRGSGKSRREVVVFEGQILSIGFNRRFHSTTLIERDGARRRFFVGAEKEQCSIGGLDLGRVDITHPGFEDRFTVWSNDQVEARTIIHPEYVERLLAVEQAFAGEDIRALFHGGDLLITVKTGDLFESGTLDAAQDQAMVETVIAQYGALADLATTLNERARAAFS